MVSIEELKAIDLKKISSPALRDNVKKLLEDYEEVEDKTMFFREAGENMKKLYGIVKKHSPEAIATEGKEDNPKPVKRGYTKKQKPKEVKAEAQTPVPEKDEKEMEANSKKAMQEIEEIGVEIESCRRVIREYNKSKREAEGKTPVKKKRITKLKEKLLGIARLIPDNLKEEKEVRDDTKKILLDTLRDLKKTWGMTIIKPAEDAIKEQFEAMDEKQSEKEERKAA
jgi:hypothetical protein